MVKYDVGCPHVGTAAVARTSTSGHFLDRIGNARSRGLRCSKCNAVVVQTERKNAQDRWAYLIMALFTLKSAVQVRARARDRDFAVAMAAGQLRSEIRHIRRDAAFATELAEEDRRRTTQPRRGRSPVAATARQPEREPSIRSVGAARRAESASPFVRRSSSQRGRQSVEDPSLQLRSPSFWLRRFAPEWKAKG